MGFIIFLLVIGGGIMFVNAIGYFVDGIGVIGKYMLWFKVKKHYNLSRFQNVASSIILWDKTEFGDYNIFLKIIKQRERKILKFELIVDKDGMVIEGDNRREADIDRFLRFVKND